MQWARIHALRIARLKATERTGPARNGASETWLPRGSSPGSTGQMRVSVTLEAANLAGTMQLNVAADVRRQNVRRNEKTASSPRPLRNSKYTDCIVLAWCH